jgi:hypothetical protein
MSRLKCFLVVMLMMSFAGCGGSGDMPDLGDVSGKVTLDGQPLVGVNVVFHPSSGRAAAAQTDSDGNYELVYLDGVSGCKVGPATVSFEWSPGMENVPSIPAKYLSTDAFKPEIKAGNNEFNFDMVSK